MKHLLILIALAASAQQIKINPITGLPDLVGSSGCTAGTGITCVGSTISVDTAVIQSRATAQSGASTYCYAADLTDDYTCSLTPTLTAYSAGSCLLVYADTANTGAATLDVDSLGAISILGPFGSALADGDIVSEVVFTVCYDGVSFIKTGPSKSVPGLNSAGLVASPQFSAGIEWFVSTVSNLFKNSYLFSWSSDGTYYGTPDTGWARNSAGVIEANNGTAGTLRDYIARQYKNTPVAVGSLQTCNAGNAGSTASVNDALAPAWGVTVANGGAAFASVVCNGANWTVTGK